MFYILNMEVYYGHTPYVHVGDYI